jgi:tetratricopeptide (TPR) repeat protein
MRPQAQLLFLLFIIPVICPAQSVTIIGGNSYARNCYTAAGLAVQMNMGSREDIDGCTTALQHGSLTMRDRAATFVNRGVIHAAGQNYKAAIKDYASAERLRPETGEVFVNRGNLYFLGRVYDKAIVEYTTAVHLDFPQIYIAHFNRGMAYENLGDYDNAETDYRRAIEMRPEWEHAQERLQRMLVKVKMKKAARNG